MGTRRRTTALARWCGLWTLLVAAIVAALVAGTPAVAGSLGDVRGADVPTAARVAPTATDRAATPSGGWTCTDDVATSAQSPVLLVHGVGLTAEENWNATLAPYLAARGHAICLVALGSFGTQDVQDNVLVVSRAIRGVAAAAGRRVDVVGHSLGAYLPRAALRLDPRLVAQVDDVVGLAGVYDLGSRRLVERCTGPCAPALHQLATRSDLLTAVARRPLPRGPSYTNIGSDGDVSITPQPAANQQSGSTSVQLQDVCPGRELQDRDHALLVGDAVSAALVVDALDHTGPADPTRVPAETCSQTWYAGFDPDAFLALVQKSAPRVNAGRVATEPSVDCRLRADCRSVAARGRVLDDVTWQVTRYSVVLRATAARWGKVRVAVGGRVVQTTVSAGKPVVLRVDRAGRSTAAYATTVPVYYTSWVEESRTSLRR